MADLNWIAVLVAFLGAGGIGAAIREVASVMNLARKGVSGKEDRRRDDLVAQRDYALARMNEAEAGERAADVRADREARARRFWQDRAARLHQTVILTGGDPGPWPEIDDTTDPPRKDPA